MSRNDDDTNVGYGPPPKHTRWKKGQNGNPTKQYARKPKSEAEVIDKLLMSSILGKTDGEPYRALGLEAILIQLWRPANLGNRQAQSTYDKYLEYFRTSTQHTVEIIFEDQEPQSAKIAMMIDKETGHD